MVRGKALLMALTAIISVLVLTGCNRTGLNSIKKNGSAVKEYNKSIEIYNKLAISFSDLAKVVKKELDNAKDFDDKFWRIYNEKETKVLQKIEAMREFQYKHREIAVVQVKIDALIENIEKYLNKVDGFRGKGKNSNLKLFETDNNSLYEDILNISTEITKSFNNIYDNYIICKKD